MYELILDPEALDFLEKMDKKLGRRIWVKIQSTKKDSSIIGSFGLRFCKHYHWVKFCKMS